MPVKGNKMKKITKNTPVNVIERLKKAFRPKIDGVFRPYSYPGE